MRLLCLAVAGASAIGVIGLVAGSDVAMAAGFALREDSAALVGTAFAGAASQASDLSTIFTNPAGMTRFSGNRAEIVGTAIVPSIEFKGTGSSLFGAVPTGGGNGGNGGGAVYVPALYGLLDVSPDLKLGIAVSAPFGLKTRYESGWVGRYLGIHSEVQTLDINPSIAYRVNDVLSVGGGLSIQRATADIDNAVNSSALLSLPPNTVLPDGNFRFTGESWAAGYNAGVLIEPVAGTRVGLTYRSRIQHRVDGDGTFSVPAPIAGAPALQSGKASAGATLPDSVTISLTHALTPALTLVSDVAWTHWSTFQDLTIRRANDSIIGSTPFRFQDAVFAAVGGIYRVGEHWTFRSGVAYDQTPVQDGFRTVRLPDQNRYIFAFGIGYSVNDAFSFDAGYLHFFLPDGSMSSSVNAASATGDAIRGTFGLHADEVSLSAHLRF